MRALLLVTLAILVAACASESMSGGQSKYEMGRDEYGSLPQADPSRLISAQHCTEQLKLDGGNLRCM